MQDIISARWTDVFERVVLACPSNEAACLVQGSGVATNAWMARAHQLGLTDLRPVQTIVEKRATFACTPGLQRPAQQVADGLLACGDYVAGPYPATLEGAVHSGLEAARCLR